MLELVENYANEQRDNSYFYELLSHDLEGMSDELKKQAKEIFADFTMKPNAGELIF